MSVSLSHSNSSAAASTATATGGSASPGFIVMRHSVRVDASEGGRWADMATRPYDTPISDFERPRLRAAELRPLMSGNIQIISSPFRRCLQTAGELAGVWGVNKIDVDHRLSEVMFAIRRHHPGIPYVAASVDLMKSSLPSGVELGSVRGVPPTVEEISVASHARFESVASEAKDHSTRDGSTIVLVSHGDAVNAIGTRYGSSVVPVPPCGWLHIASKDGKLTAGGGDDPAILLGFALE